MNGTARFSECAGFRPAQLALLFEQFSNRAGNSPQVAYFLPGLVLHPVPHLQNDVHRRLIVY
jgi:hypothetical protein